MDHKQDGLIKHEQRSFVQGLLKDPPASEIGEQALSKVINAHVFSKYVEGRGGSRIFNAASQASLPTLRTGYTASKTGATITKTVGTDFTSADEGRFYIYNNVHYEMVQFVNANQMICKDTTTTWLSTAGGAVRGKVCADAKHGKQKKLIILIDTRVFIADSTTIAAYTEVFNLDPDDPTETISYFEEIKDDMILWNSKGCYRINLTSTLPYMWKTNTPVVSTLITEVERTSKKVYGRRYLLTMVRMQGSMHSNRGNGGKIEQESGATKWSDYYSRDYGEVFTQIPVGPGTDTYQALIGGATGSDLAGWAAVSDGEFVVEINDEIFNIEVDFTGSLNIGEIAYRIECALRVFFDTAECYYDEDHFVINSGHKDAGTVGYASNGLGGTDISGAVYLNMTSPSASPVGSGLILTQYVDQPNIITPLTIPLNTNASIIEHHWTHFGIWSTKDTGKFGVDAMTGKGNNKELYVWNGDVPIAKAFTATYAFATGKIVASAGQFSVWDRGSDIEFYFSTPNKTFAIRRYSSASTVYACDFNLTITDNTESLSTAIQSGELFAANGDDIPEIDDIFIVNGTGDFTGDDLYTAKGNVAPAAGDLFKITSNVSGAETVTYIRSQAADLASTSAAIGGGDIFTASQAGTTVTKTAGDRNFTAADVGKPIFWPDGLVTWISGFTGVDVVTVRESATRVSQGCTMDPVSRKYNDNVSDDTLHDRIKNFSLQVRTREPIPESNIGTVAPGFVFFASKYDKEVRYSMIPLLMDYYVGYYNAQYHFDDHVQDSILALRTLPDVVVAICRNKIYIGKTNISGKILASGNEEIAIFTGFSEAESATGCLGSGSIQETPSGSLIMLINKGGVPGCAELVGNRFGMDLLMTADGSTGLIKKDIQKLHSSFASAYSNGEFVIWGIE